MVRGLDLIQSDFGDDRISQSVNFISKFVRFGGFVHPVLFPLIRIHMAASADVEPTGLSKPFEGPLVRVKKMKRTQSLWMELTGDGLLVLVCFLRGEFKKKTQYFSVITSTHSCLKTPAKSSTKPTPGSNSKRIPLLRVS